MVRIEGGNEETVTTPIKLYRDGWAIGYFKQIRNEFVFFTTVVLDQRTSGLRQGDIDIISDKLKELNASVPVSR